MKILTIGFLVFLSWSALSTYIYVCKIKGLCNERETVMINTVSIKDAYTADSLPNTLAGEPKKMPEPHLIYFAFDKSEFSQNEETDKYVIESNAYLVQNSQARLSITGHTDALGSDEYNKALGYRRVQSVQHYFESRGIPASQILTESKGEKEPAENNITIDGRAKNRRTVITIK